MRLTWATQHVPGWLGFMVRHPVSTNNQRKEIKEEKRRKEKKKRRRKLQTKMERRRKKPVPNKMNQKVQITYRKYRVGLKTE